MAGLKIPNTESVWLRMPNGKRELDVKYGWKFEMGKSGILNGKCGGTLRKVVQKYYLFSEYCVVYQLFGC